MPPDERPIPRYVAEPPQEPLPYGRWAETLAGHFVEACAGHGDPEEILWFPERTWGGRTYVPATALTGEGELFGFVSYLRGPDAEAPTGFAAVADLTTETVENNPDWRLDLSDHELAPWRGPKGRRGTMTLVWGEALVPDGVVATAELGPTTTDQCELVEDRFTLVSLDDYTGDLLEVRLYGAGGAQLAAESLYDEDGEPEPE